MTLVLPLRLRTNRILVHLVLPFTSMLAQSSLHLGQIQGNCIGGFLKDSQAMLFLHVTDRERAAATLRGSSIDDGTIGSGSILAHVLASSSEEVLRFNAVFKRARHHSNPVEMPAVTWTNVIFSVAGLEKLGIPKTDLERFPDAIRQGMRARAGKLGDLDASSPQYWDRIVDWDSVDLVLIVASDLPTETDVSNANGRVGQYLSLIQAAGSGLEFCAPQDAPPPLPPDAPGFIYGRTRDDDPAIEHFGFRDSISQPGIRGVDLPTNPIDRPDQGHPGQPLLHPGEFVIGYPRQLPRALPGHTGPNPAPSTVLSGDGPVCDPPDFTVDPVGSRRKLPLWAKDGSFVVFRRLEQDVRGFNAFVETQCRKQGISADFFKAKLLGRYPSGASLAKGDVAVTATDPGNLCPALGNDERLNNDFGYADDPNGEVVPWAAHIRKVNPRNQVATNERGQHITELGELLDPKDAESRNQTHRMLRRGIPYGKPWSEHDAPDAKRGLLFLAYQSDIERQFEFVQRSWMLNWNFPAINAGQDALFTPQTLCGHEMSLPLGLPPNCQSTDVASGSPIRTTGIQHFVTTRGGGYYFSPSLSTLHTLLQARSREPR